MVEFLALEADPPFLDEKMKEAIEKEKAELAGWRDGTIQMHLNEARLTLSELGVKR